MNLAPTAEQQELQAGARRFLEKEITRERLLAWDRTAEGYDAAFWEAMSGLGWLAFSLPENVGGGGESLLAMALLLEECGRRLVPASVPSAVLGARALALLGGASAEAELPALASGKRQATLALLEPDGSSDASRSATRIERGKLHGEKWYVRQGVTADWLLVAARNGDDPSVLLVPARAPGITRRELGTFGGDRQSVFRFDGVAVDPASRLANGEAARRALASIRDQAVALALAEMIGGFTEVFEMTVAYMKEREQFGQPLGKFQGVQFRCADMATSLSGARHLAYQAIWRLSEGLDATRELALARAWCGAAYKQGTLDAHQLHGGAGYVVEHPLHRYAERAQSYSILYCAEDPALAEAATLLLGP